MIGAIVRAHGDDPALLAGLADYQIATLDDIAACGTLACGLHRERCDHCDDVRLAPNTCGNRSCPHCQGAERAAWVAARERELLPCGYFHAVFTLPSELRDIAWACRGVVLDALLRAAGDAALHLAREPRHLGAEVGTIAVLHTWTRDLRWHPHVHLIVTAGGYDAGRDRWIEPRRTRGQRRPFLVPIAALRVAFRRRLARLLYRAYEAGAFGADLCACFPALASRASLRALLGRLAQKTWCIHIEPPAPSPRHLLRYLGAYINRVAIRAQRIVAHDVEAGTVTYRWEPVGKPGQTQTRTVAATDFLRSFAQHILPPRFVRIRFRGLWATAHRRTKLDRARACLARRAGPAGAPTPTPTPDGADLSVAPAVLDAAPVGDRCIACGIGHYRRDPGPCPRPPRAQRRALLRALRRQDRERAMSQPATASA